MNTPLTMEHLNIICTVQDYTRFLRSYHMILLGNHQYDWYKQAQRFYNKLPLPEGMNTCNACFDAIIRYPTDGKLSVNADDLPRKFMFGY